MRDHIRKLLYEIAVKGQNPLNEREIVLFKFLNKKRDQNKGMSNSKIEENIESFLRMLKMNIKLKKHYRQLYLLNYRPNGDYENLTYDEFIGPDKFKSERSSNSGSREYTLGRRSFRGANLEGKWDKDKNGEVYYVVLSYGWYPIYIYKNNVWYEVTDNYSQTTSKHKSQSRPFNLSDYTDDIIVYAKPNEMKEIMYGNISYEDVIKNKTNQLLGDKSQFMSKRSKGTKFTYNDNGEEVQAVVQYKIEDLKLEGSQVIIEITIYDIKNGKDQRSITMTNQEIKKLAETSIKNDLHRNLSQYLKDISSEYKPEDKRMPETYMIRFKYN